MYGLVFAGGGVRGAYQAGVWKALLELRVKVGAVTGTSIGAVNAALFAQKSFETAYSLWRKVRLEDIIELGGAECGDNLFDIKNLVKIYKDICKNEGFDMSPLKRLLTEVIDEKKLRKSAIDFGCVTYSLSGMKPAQVFRSDIPDGKIVDYILASASILGVKEIDGERFTDGGMANNMPTDMLIEKGYTDIIEVNVHGPGVYKTVNTSGCNIISLSCAAPAVGIMDFNPEGIEKSIAEGYLDCMRAFGKLGGERYYIKTEKGEILSPEILCGLEKAAEVFGTDRLRAYTVTELARAVLAEYDKSRESGEESRDEKKLIPWLVEKLEGGSNDLIKSGLEILGSNYDAASAILYFKRKLR